MRTCRLCDARSTPKCASKTYGVVCPTATASTFLRTESLMTYLKCSLIFFMLLPTSLSAADAVLVEAESFANHGGWVLDTQFIDNMGSPYLLAHGMGRPLADATTEITFPSTGEYHVFVRTKDWVARWDAPGHPGKFQVLVDGEALPETFGTQGKEWFWHHGGVVNIQNPSAMIGLHDLTGFDGRCDAILFTKENTPPPNEGQVLPAWRRKLLGLAEQPTKKEGYDLVVVGGGYSGLGSAISAANGLQGRTHPEPSCAWGQWVKRGACVGDGTHSSRRVSTYW